MPSIREKLLTLINLFTKDIRDAFLASIADITNNIILNNVIKAIEAGDVEGAFRALGFNQAALRPLIVAIERAYEQGGIFTGSTFPKWLNTPSGKVVFRFDVRNSRAEAYLRDKSSTLITSITDDIRTTVRSQLTVGMQEGRNPRNVALDIVGRVDLTTGNRVGGIIGLTPGQEIWVRNTRQDLLTLNDNYFSRELRDKRFDPTVRAAIDKGEPLPADVVDKLTDRYKANALKYRGDAIARTEALQSLNASEYEAVLQAVDMGAAREKDVQREWDGTLDDRIRYTHRKMDGQRVGLHEPFVSPSGARMMYPGDTKLGAPASEVVMCRCRAKTVVDWLASVAE